MKIFGPFSLGLGPKIRKIAEILGRATIFDLVPASFVAGATFSSGKIGVNNFIGGGDETLPPVSSRSNYIIKYLLYLGGVQGFEVSTKDCTLKWADGSNHGLTILMYKIEGRTTHNSTWVTLAESKFIHYILSIFNSKTFSL